MTPEEELEALLRRHSLGAAIDVFAPHSAVAHYLRQLQSLNELLRARAVESPELSPQYLEDLSALSRDKADAFLQALVSVESTEMLCAAWRIIQGMEIDGVSLNYNRLQQFLLQVRLRLPAEHERTEEYISRSINDVSFIRHLGGAELDDKPVFVGFYPLPT